MHTRTVIARDLIEASAVVRPCQECRDYLPSYTGAEEGEALLAAYQYRCDEIAVGREDSQGSVDDSRHGPDVDDSRHGPDDDDSRESDDNDSLEADDSDSLVSEASDSSVTNNEEQPAHDNFNFEVVSKRVLGGAILNCRDQWICKL